MKNKQTKEYIYIYQICFKTIHLFNKSFLMGLVKNDIHVY